MKKKIKKKARKVTATKTASKRKVFQLPVDSTLKGLLTAAAKKAKFPTWKSFAKATLLAAA